MDIGKRLKKLRQHKELTQEELAERTDLTKGYISQLEHDQSSPSMETFFAILEVLGEKPADFFQDHVTQKIVYPAAEQTVYADAEKGYTLNWLVPASNENEMEPVLIKLAPHGSFKPFQPSAAETFLYVLSGQVGLQLGAEKYQAQAGDSLYFHATERHQIHNLTSQTSQLLLVATASYL
ncbi:cro CI family transcriptional regulator [Lactobacillus selangorensis]|uniref:Cro CI family transcriptional regulator n=1 Tax=Lactobacillus selangorensis TaxID=81857 RepID=A0A0R2FYK4_9LACO|nr:XRE family transcriptional regulator [Lactobacillus selangorensis]KRN27669.1 cro CI family transcriptional regulator [Lactobacillus selangorensis]KRN30364.1 cro CI family transcriptional regulator [Lactobacillus selangorensis]